MSGLGSMISGIGQMALAPGQHEAELGQLQAETKAEDTNLQLKAQQAREQGAFEAGKQRISTGQLVAKQAAAYTNSGVDAGVGTAAQVQANTAAVGELDAQQIQNNAARAAWGYAESRKTLQQVYQAKKSQNDMKLTGTLIGGAGQYSQGVVDTFKSAMGGG